MDKGWMCCCLLALGLRSSWRTKPGCAQTLSCPFPEGQWIKRENLESFAPWCLQPPGWLCHSPDKDCPLCPTQ